MLELLADTKAIITRNLLVTRQRYVCEKEYYDELLLLLLRTIIIIVIVITLLGTNIFGGYDYY